MKVWFIDIFCVLWNVDVGSVFILLNCDLVF